MSVLQTFNYGARQAARVAWYAAHYAETLRRTGFGASGRGADYEPRTPPPDPAALRRAWWTLFMRDLKYVREGRYLAPEAREFAHPRRMLDRSRLYFDDLNAVQTRRELGVHQEPANDENRKRFPRYYLQNFHFQSGGWLSDESAKLYDTQVEILFTGAAGAMRRQALPHLMEALRDRDARAMRMLDVAGGTGSWAREVKRNAPGLHVTLMDLSDAYLREATATLQPFGRWAALQGNAEAIPAADASFDVVSCVYLFHELPPKVRSRVASEIARVLKPGGLFLFTDSLQYGDAPELDRLLEMFPINFHEPYYESYCREDLDALFGASGLRVERQTLAYLSKAVAFRKAV